ncbi:hypothetical protein Nepgr_006205 [Nepenthes gracilis]|uniref:Myb-like domain-containing protein n=1 Tax=Nepenthes gracilis TaxID=150966 RepID=A0AAD3XHD3_NEPGR|nr:hypothetical protein Nepgr_006205 [Nepenthes gracilis]
MLANKTDVDKVEMRKGLWTKEKDLLLQQYIEKHGEGNWHQFTSPSPQTLVAVNPSPPLTLIVLFIRTELVALLVGCRRCARCVILDISSQIEAWYFRPNNESFNRHTWWI